MAALENLTRPEYLKFDVAGLDHQFRHKPEKFWQQQGEAQALRIFHRAAREIPAYRDFLKKNQIHADKIRNIADFAAVPFTNKKNYTSAYPLRDQVWQKDLSRSKLMAMSSGTSGEPKFWPRAEAQEFEAAVMHELVYRNSFAIHKYKTLMLIGFPMGVYVSGVATLLPSWLVSLKYNLTVVSVGNHKPDMLRMLKNAGPEYDQMVLIGHPFFIKDVLETAEQEKIPLKKMKLRLMFCSEGFSEAWRDHVLRIIGSKTPGDAISVYGSSEMLLMGYETDLTIKFRRQLTSTPKLTQQVWGREIIPNIFQYNPLLRYIETVNNELVFTAASGVPLIRFNLRDLGQTVTHAQLAAEFKNLPTKQSWQLPLVGLWGRSDQTLIFYAANIYPEHIQSALQHGSLINKLTGKFVMRKGELKNLDEFLEINLELNQDVKPGTTLAKQIERRVVDTLSQINMEYHFLKNHLDKDLTPKIKLWPYHSEHYFKPGLKPKYILS